MKETEQGDNKSGVVFYEEAFLSIKNTSVAIQQTFNWVYVPKDSAAGSSAKKQNEGFAIQSETPLEYNFVEPLFEHTIYQYTLSCRAKGNGTIVLFQKDGKESKEFLIHSESFETVAFTLGSGFSLNTKIVSAISFQGDLQVESITILQEKLNNERTVCLGIIESISNVPDIEKANYPDCYYTAKFVVKDILDGNPTPQNIQLLIPAFLNNKIDPLSKMMKKGKWKVSIRPFSLATKEEQEIEQVDEIESFLYTPYILVAASNEKQIAKISGVPILEGEPYLSPFDNPVNPPLPEQYRETSMRIIEKELAKVNSFLEQTKNDESLNLDFQMAWNEKQKEYESLDNNLVWAREQNSFFALPKKYDLVSSVKITDENVDSLVEFNRFFQSQGIQFIIQIIPDYYDIAALVLNPSFQKFGDRNSAYVAKRLLERGIEAHYLSDELVKNALKYERMYFYPGNFHPDEGTTDTATSKMAQRLEMFGDTIPKDLDPNLFSRERRDTGFGSRLKWPENVDIGHNEAGSNVQVPYVLYNNEILNSNPSSIILVFGNSFTLEPMTKNAYISYLAEKILHCCSCSAMGGVSALTSFPQRFLSNPKELKGKLVAVLPISILYLIDKRYTFPNVKIMDNVLKNADKTEFVANLPLKQIDSPIFPTSFNFSYKFLDQYLPSRTSCVALSEVHSKVTLPIPNNINAKKVRISIQPLYRYGASILFNGEKCVLPSRYTPQWEIMDFDIDETNKSITIELDIDNCSSRETKVLIGNVSLFM